MVIKKKDIKNQTRHISINVIIAKRILWLVKKEKPLSFVVRHVHMNQKRNLKNVNNVELYLIHQGQKQFFVAENAYLKT